MSTLLRIKGLLTEGIPAPGCHPDSGGKHTYTVALETNTSPVEGAGVREHGCVTDPTGPWAYQALVSTGLGSKRVRVGHTEVGGSEAAMLADQKKKGWLRHGQRLWDGGRNLPASSNCIVGSDGCLRCLKPLTSRGC